MRLVTVTGPVNVTTASAVSNAWPPPSMVKLTGKVAPTVNVPDAGESAIDAVWATWAGRAAGAAAALGVASLLVR